MGDFLLTSRYNMSVEIKTVATLTNTLNLKELSLLQTALSLSLSQNTSSYC